MVEWWWEHLSHVSLSLFVFQLTAATVLFIGVSTDHRKGGKHHVGKHFLEAAAATTAGVRHRRRHMRNFSRLNIRSDHYGSPPKRSHGRRCRRRCGGGGGGGYGCGRRVAPLIFVHRPHSFVSISALLSLVLLHSFDSDLILACKMEKRRDDNDMDQRDVGKDSNINECA